MVSRRLMAVDSIVMLEGDQDGRENQSNQLGLRPSPARQAKDQFSPKRVESLS
jgi:hypothetical protein